MVGKPSKAKDVELKTGEIIIPVSNGLLRINTENVIVKEGTLDQWGTFPRAGVGAGKRALLIILDVEKKVNEECQES